MVRARVGFGLRDLIIVGVRARCSDLLKNLVSMLYNNQSFSSCNFLCPFCFLVVHPLFSYLFPSPSFCHHSRYSLVPLSLVLLSFVLSNLRANASCYCIMRLA